MRTGGRRSAAAHAADIATLPVVPRPKPPASLNEEQAREWDAVVARMPMGWFTRETEPILEAYCQQTVWQRVLNAELEAARGTPKFMQLIKLANDTAKTLLLLATKMRLTQQSTYDKTKKKPIRVETPWDE